MLPACFSFKMQFTTWITYYFFCQLCHTEVLKSHKEFIQSSVCQAVLAILIRRSMVIGKIPCLFAPTFRQNDMLLGKGKFFTLNDMACVNHVFNTLGSSCDFPLGTWKCFCRGSMPGHTTFQARGSMTFQMRISRGRPWQRGPRYGCVIVSLL